MHIGVVSDTHLPRFGAALPRALVAGMREAGVERIIHLGDFTGDHVPALFETIGPLDAVAGNNDGPAIIARYGRRRIVELGGVRLGLTHGDLGPGATTPERARRAFAEAEADAILFGHSHAQLLERLADGRWLINPGSPTDKRRQAAFSWVSLVIRPGPHGSAVMEPTLHTFDDRSA